MDDRTILLIVACSAPVFWVGILYLAAWLGGWKKLAVHYRAMHAPDGTRFRWQHASLGRMTNYSCCLSYISNSEGFYVRPALLLRIAHPPLFIPWTDIVSADESGPKWMRQVTFRFEKAPDVAYAVPKQFASRMLESAKAEGSDQPVAIG